MISRLYYLKNVINTVYSEPPWCTLSFTVHVFPFPNGTFCIKIPLDSPGRAYAQYQSWKLTRRRKCEIVLSLKGRENENHLPHFITIHLSFDGHQQLYLKNYDLRTIFYEKPYIIPYFFNQYKRNKYSEIDINN